MYMYIHTYTYARIHISTYTHVYSLGVKGLKGAVDEFRYIVVLP
jgi:hypothetical protein